MRNILAISTLAIFGIAAGNAMACDYGDEASASAPEAVASIAPPAATQAMTAPAVAKTATTTRNAAKPVAVKTKAKVSDPKVAASSTN
ncbi:MAG: hypothetical protein E6H66_13195 [Betaproteobacteria bacterium]|nr:MAG: hypothetical protein E6H66_13195 [Betaproteobacteria bacterium]